MTEIHISRKHLDESNPENLRFKSTPGISEELIREISRQKDEPKWMLEIRLKGLKAWEELPMPTWGPDLSDLDISNLHLYVLPDAKKNSTTWDEVPNDIKTTFEKLGIPKAERNALAGVGAQYESEVIYHSLKKEWEEMGVIFVDFDEAIKSHESLVREHLMKQVVPIRLHKFTALHAALLSGGTFIYIPPGITVDSPLQAYFRMNAKSAGQFEHTLIIVDKGANMQYIEGCSAPQYNKNSLHAGCVEIHVKEGARARYSSIENWSKNTYNLNTKRALIGRDAHIEWINGNLGSRVTMLYPASILAGEGSSSDFIGIAYAGDSQHQDMGCKVFHLKSNTSSTITSKSISKDGGISTYRGIVEVAKNAKNTSASIECDALMIDSKSVSNTFPTMNIHSNDATIAHEATVGKISDDDLLYLTSRGLDEETARQMIVSGFIEPIVKELPLEYALELNRLIELEMEGSLG